MAKKIIIYQTGGSYFPFTEEIKNYDYLITHRGAVLKGSNEKDIYKPFRKEINIAFMGMKGYESYKKQGDFPITAVQLDEGLKFIANLAVEFDIKPSTTSILTSYEQKKRKYGIVNIAETDIVSLPTQAYLFPDEVGKYLRSKVKFYIKYGLDNDNENKNEEKCIS